MKSQIRNASRALTAVHKVLLDETIREYQHREGRPLSPQDAWRAAMNDPFFAWLRPVSMLIAEIDELLTAVDEIDAGLAHGIRLEVESLLNGMTTGEPFAKRYRDMMQQNPELVARHGELKASLAPLTAPADGSKVLTRDEWPLERPESDEPVN